MHATEAGTASGSGKTRSRIRTLIVDDSDVSAEAISHYLGRAARIELVGRARDGCEALTEVERQRPDLVIMDVSMPCMDGLSALVAIKRRADPPRVIMVSFDNGMRHRVAAKEAGADGFCGKLDTHRDLLPCILGLFPEADE